ncbi:MAG: replication factor C large subunit [Candidatus Diapherotrites archaeon]|nr:replication factor C large subunit [Candidatus Diapherotrites archaeon]
MLWTEKYFPVSWEGFVGNSEIVEKVRSWAQEWANGKPQPPLMLWGATGAGKTALAYLAAKLMDWDVLELNASDLRSADEIERLAGHAGVNATLWGRMRLILLDEADELQGTDRGGMGAILSVLSSSKFPLLLTANDIYADKKLAPLREKCLCLEFKKINYLSLAVRLREILAQEKIPFDEEAVKLLARNSSGDFRGALLDLQSLASAGNISLAAVESVGSRERQQNVFNVMKEVFHGKTLQQVREARLSSSLDSDMLSAWVEENIPRQIVGESERAEAFAWLSRSDMFRGRIFRRQEYGFLRYSEELGTSAIALSNRHPVKGFVPFQFPLILSALSRSMGKRHLRSGLAQKIGEKTHASVRRVLSADLPYWQFMAQEGRAADFVRGMDLSEGELAFLLETEASSVKVKKIMESVHPSEEKKETRKVTPKKTKSSSAEKTVQSEAKPSESNPAPVDLWKKQTKLY